MSRNRKKLRQTDKKQAAAERQSEALYKKAEFAVDALALPFVKWYEEADGNTGSEALQVLQSVKQFLWLYGASGAPVLATEFDAGVFLRTTSQLEELGSADEENRVFHVIMDDVQVYTAFLDATGTWTGDADHLDIILESFDLDGELEAELSAGEEGAADEAEDAAAADAVSALLAWIGAGKELTATGALRLADIAGAAAAVGLHAVGSQKRLSEDEVGALADADGRLPQVVRSMAELEPLNDAWQTLQDQGLIEITGKKVSVTADGRERLASAPELAPIG
ncbi:MULTISPECIES: hypothetical protein [Arthrobacter]|uniref:Uncharacterized protein n=2 Tax=Arthrobacter TaxID=1663 RepID=A0ABU9KJP9_9MICC|nr:hypothetical protein [Arthrobacter sp. YJM1]MDP5226138.1 hypothetical protein [Arthrobacter sp. YJM1]